MDITFTEAIKLFYNKYTDFDTRATRAEYWYVVLYTLVGGLVLGGVSDWLGYIFSIANFIPSIAIAVRRMHDIGKSGWWVLISLIPIIGIIWYIILAIKPSEGPNRYGEA